MLRTILNIVLLLVAIAFSVVGYHRWALAVLGLLLFRVFRFQIARLTSVASRLEDLASENSCNTALMCRFSIEKALSHSSVETLFENLRLQGKILTGDFNSWVAVLVENYLKKYERTEGWEEVRFNVKNGLLFLNGEPQFIDIIHHAVTVPYSLEDERPEAQFRSLFTSSTDYEISVRVVVVNGLLALQVGDFDKKSSPSNDNEYLATYQTWVTLTVFPLMYFSHRHGLPVRSLGMLLGVTSKVSDKRLVEWRGSHQDIATYRLLCDDRANVWDTAKQEQAFVRARDIILKKEGFDSFGSKREIGDPDLGETYLNDYLYVHFQNYNLTRTERWVADYYEERP